MVIRTCVVSNHPRIPEPRRKTANGIFAKSSRWRWEILTTPWLMRWSLASRILVAKEWWNNNWQQPVLVPSVCCLIHTVIFNNKSRLKSCEASQMQVLSSWPILHESTWHHDNVTDYHDYILSAACHRCIQMKRCASRFAAPWHSEMDGGRFGRLGAQWNIYNGTWKVVPKTQLSWTTSLTRDD